MTTQQFWTWFQQNEGKYYIFPLMSTEEQEAYKQALHNNLDAYLLGIGFEIKFCETYNSLATLMLFGNGDDKMFVLIKQLVLNVPTMANWTVICAQRKIKNLSNNKTLGPSNYKLSLDQVYFQPVFKTNEYSKITIKIFTTKKVAGAKRRQFKNLCIQFLTEMVGSETLDTHISLIRCHLNSQVPGVALKIYNFHVFIKSLTQVYK